MTSPEENREIVRRLNDIWRGELAIVDEFVADDYRNHNPIVPDAPPGPEGFKENVAALRRGFPDIDFTIEEVVAEGDLVVFRTIGHGTHEGELMGIAPTGRTVTLAGFVMFRFEDGQIAERWAQYDTFGMLQQLGALPDLDGRPGSTS